MSAAALAGEDRVLGLLRGLCAGFGSGGIEVVADPRLTAFAPQLNRILVARRFLSADTPVAIGALLHEVGHALVTRYHRFAPPADALPALWQLSLNAVEESRVHGFLRQRLPGVGPYLEALFGMDEPPDRMPLESDLVVFLAATATWDRYPTLPFLCDFPAAAASFRRTRDARVRYSHRLPPPDLSVRPDLWHRYARDVLPALTEPPANSPVPLEAEILCAAASALGIFATEIWPEILRLATRDEHRIAGSLASGPDLRQAAEQTAQGPAGAEMARLALRAWADRHGMAAEPDAPSDAALGKLAKHLFRQFIEAKEPRQPIGTTLSGGRKARETKRAGEPGAEAGSGQAPGEAARTAEDDMRRAQQALAEVLRRAVPRRPVRLKSGFRAGSAIDLDLVMRSAATGRDADRIWSRRQVELPALASLLLVDLSGSMRGEKVEAAIAATRALSTALAEIRGVSWCVLGFQDVTIPFVRFGERPDPRVLARIEAMREEVAGTRPGGNNQPGYNDDGPCLLVAAEQLLARPERDRLLIVISDGNPEGRRSNTDDLHKAVAVVGFMPRLTLFGLGLGPSTDHVTRYYPLSQANITLGDLAPAIGRLLAVRLRAATS